MQRHVKPIFETSTSKLNNGFASEFDIADLDSDEWAPIIKGVRKVHDEDLMVSFRAYKSGNNDGKKYPRMNVMLGRAIHEKLGWKLKDKVMVIENTRDKSQFLICKAASGWKLTSPDNTAAYSFSFRLDRDIPYFGSVPVKYIIHKNGTIQFKIPMDGAISGEGLAR